MRLVEQELRKQEVGHPTEPGNHLIRGFERRTQHDGCRQPKPQSDGRESKCEVANHPTTMSNSVSGSNSKVGARARVKPGKCQKGESDPGGGSAERMKGHEEPSKAADQNADAEVEPAQPSVQRKVANAQLRGELERSESECDY